MAASDHLLRTFARLLPRDVRERVFEPAWNDIRLDDRQGAAASAWSAGVARVVLVAECLRLGLQHLFWRHGRPTPLLMNAVVIVGVVSLVLMRLRYGVSPHDQ